MTFNEHLLLLLLLISIHGSTYDCSTIKRDSNEGVMSGSRTRDSALGKSLFDGTEERNFEQEILQELNHLSSRRQREIFNDLEKQNEKFNTSLKTMALSQPENLSPINVEELKNIRNTIKTSNSSLPAIRNKRTLNFLLSVVARAMGYSLTPTSPDAEWIPRSQPSPSQPCTTPAPPCTTSAPPCTTPAPPCTTSAPPCTTPAPPCTTPAPPCTSNPPCAVAPSTPPCPGPSALMQPATISPSQIDANTINYPYRPVRTIPLFNFAPLPIGVRVPYPPLLQPPAQQRSSCAPQGPSPPCSTTPAPSPPPCMPPPTLGTPPRRPTTPPCGTTPAARPSPCTSTPPCAAVPSPLPSCTTPPVPPSPCGTPPSAPCGNPPPPPSPSQPPKKGSVLLEYDDPVRIQIFSNGKKYLPASGIIYSGEDDDEKEDFNSSFALSKKKDEDHEGEKEMEEEHLEEEEEDETPGQPKRYEEEDESETNLSIVKKPAVEDKQKINRWQLISSMRTGPLIANEGGKNDERGDTSKYDKAAKSLKVKKPKRKKWVRIVKKQRRKTKTDLNPSDNFPAYSSDTFPEASQIASKLYGKRNSHNGFGSLEKDVSDYSDDFSTDTSEDVTQIDLKKVIVNNKLLHLPDRPMENRRYEFNINPYALEPEEERRQKIEKAVERYVEDYVEKQLGDELVKNTGVPKTTVFEFATKNGPKIQTITTTIAKTSRTGNSPNLKLQNKPDTPSLYKTPNRNAHALRKDSYEENLSNRGDTSFETFTIHA